MSTDRVVSGATERVVFTVHAEPPWLLHLTGELDIAAAPGLTAALEGPIQRGGTIGLDLAELQFMDSTGINAFCDAVNQVGERGRLVLLCPTPRVRRILEICGLINAFDIFDELPVLRPD